MRFLAIVTYSHGKKLTHEFRCPLERASWVRQLKQDDPGARVKLKNQVDPADVGTRDAWYEKGGC